MKRATLLGALGAFVALAPVLSCGGGDEGGGGGGAGEAAFTDSDRAALVDQISTATTSIAMTVAGSLVFVPQVPSQTKSQDVSPKASSLSCTASSGSTCSCTYGGEVIRCHVTVDEQELCAVSGSQWLKGSIDATGTPTVATVEGHVALALGPPACVVSTDGLTLEGTVATTVSAQSTGDTFHMLFRMFSSGLTATRGGKELGVCLVDITITEGGASGTMCGKPWPPGMPTPAPTPTTVWR